MQKKKSRQMRMMAALIAAAQATIGEEAIDFTLESLDGGMVSLGDLRGQVVLLNFFGYG
jgi:cytochrome oxidase Cu insertion factor (SCO1/SenC/PrrC family)